MQIENIFAKSISRNLEGVIKVGRKSQALIEQELDEYVVTDELYTHFQTFFTAYAAALSQPTTDMGVWISGFFGSGKSHLLQIFTYLLENRAVGVRHAIDFFVDEPKIDDPALLKTMQDVAANAVHSDVILFNVDSKNQQTSNGSKELLQIFVNVFNEMRGYSPSMPYVAKLEEYLDRKGKYQAFQQAFDEISGTPWKEEGGDGTQDGRNDFLFVMDEIKEALVQAQVYEADEADRVVENLEGNYAITIQQFAQEVTAYCQAKGPMHRVVFLVDEIGQYIGSDTRLMLDLQTITEELSHAGGQAWIIVTSQQNIDEVIKVSGDDFSKIQGRFHTRLSLSSANVDEVLKRRILAKTDGAAQVLTSLYDREDLNLKNILRFTANTPFQRLYENRDDFSETYPFVSYQFDLLQHTLTDIRKNSASGKSIASGERSMLAVFKESAQARKDEEIRILIPYDAFYDPIAKFVDHIHQQVIIKAGKNKNLNTFDIRVLKVLFLVKYVKTFKANVDNLTTLLVDSIHADRLTLQQRVVTSLQRLIHEVLVQKNLDEYSFLTDQEQDINRNIQNTPVDTDEITQYIANEIFGGILKNQAFTYSKRYSFRYDQYVDNRLVSSGAHNTLSLNILTPYALSEAHLAYTDETIAAQGMGNAKQLILRLPPNATFWEDITKVLQIRKYTQKASITNAVVAGIINVKNQEMEELRHYISQRIREALGQADVYVNGDKKNIKASTPTERVYAGMIFLVETIFYKLGKMGGQEPSENDIQHVLQTELTGALFTNKEEYERTAGAQDEIIQYIQLRMARHQTVVLRELLERFQDAPYGFDPKDIFYCVAILYKKGKLTLTLHSEAVPLDTPAPMLYAYVTQPAYRDKLILAQRVAVAKKKIDAAKEVRQVCFKHTTPSREEDNIMEVIQDDIQHEITYMDMQILPNFAETNRFHAYYHGQELVEKLKTYWQQALQQRQAEGFFTYLYDHADEIQDLYEEGYEDLRAFFDPQKPQQLQLFNRACEKYKHVQDDIPAASNQDVKRAKDDLADIILSDTPYGKINTLNDLINRLDEAYHALLENERQQAVIKVETMGDMILTQVLEPAVFGNRDGLRQQVIQQFAAYKEDILQANSLSSIKVAHSAAVDKKDWFISEVNFRSQQYQEEQERKAAAARDGHVAQPTPTPVKPVTIAVALSMHDLRPKQAGMLQNEADVTAFVEEIRKKLLEEIHSGKKITIIE